MKMVPKIALAVAALWGVAWLLPDSPASEDRSFMTVYVQTSDVGDVPSTDVPERILAGGPLPSGVTVYALNRPGLQKYRYAHVNNRYLLIDAQGHVVGAIVRASAPLAA